MFRSSSAAAIAIFLTIAMAGCGGDESSSSSSETSSDPVSVATSSEAESFLTAAGRMCNQAHQTALADANRLGYWDHQLTPDEQAEYYEGRASQVEDLIRALGTLEPTPDFADGWATTLGHLAEYGEWAGANVSSINATSSTVDESSPDSLQSFRAVFDLGYGHACQDLFDMN